MQTVFPITFESTVNERSSIFLLSLTDPVIIEQSKFTDHEMDLLKHIAPEKLHRQRMLKKFTALQLVEEYFTV